MKIPTPKKLSYSVFCNIYCLVVVAFLAIAAAPTPPPPASRALQVTTSLVLTDTNFFQANTGRLSATLSTLGITPSGSALVQISSNTYSLRGNLISIVTNGDEAEVSVKGYSVGPVQHGYFAGGTEASPTNAPQGLIYGIGSRPHNGTAFTEHSSAAIHWISGNVTTPTNYHTGLRFLTTPFGTTNRETSLEITNGFMVQFKTFSCQAYKFSAPQLITNSTQTAILFDNEHWNFGITHSTNTLTSRFTVPMAGLYRITANIVYEQNALGSRLVHFRANGNTNDRYGYQTLQNVGAALATFVSTTTVLKLAANDYVEVYTFQDSGGTISVVNETTQPGVCRFTIEYVGRSTP